MPLRDPLRRLQEAATVEKFLDQAIRPSGRLAEIESQLSSARGIDRLLLLQRRQNEMARLEGAFITVAADYGRRRGISYAAWREAGVSKAVLARAGIRSPAGY